MRRVRMNTSRILSREIKNESYHVSQSQHSQHSKKSRNQYIDNPSPRRLACPQPKKKQPCRDGLSILTLVLTIPGGQWGHGWGKEPRRSYPHCLDARPARLAHRPASNCDGTFMNSTASFLNADRGLCAARLSRTCGTCCMSWRVHRPSRGGSL